MIPQADLERYILDRHAFRREQIILSNGKRLGECEEPWQTEHIFAPLDARNGDGWKYRLLYFELHRGAAKSAVLAAEALTIGILDEDTRCYLLAGDKDQAAIMRDMLEGYIHRNSSLESSFRIFRDEIVVPATDTRIRVLSSDAPTTYGLGGLSRRFRALCDELWIWPGRELWDAIFTAAPKSEDWRIIVASNAGFDTESVAWDVRELARKQADPRYYLYAPEGIVAGWISPEDVDTQRASLPPQVFQRLWENKWTEGSGSFITREQLDRNIDATWRPQLQGQNGHQYYVGLDLGLTRDRTARAVVHFDREGDRVVLDDLRIWQGTPAHPVNIEEIEDDLVSCDTRFGRPSFHLDPWQLKGSIQRLQTSLRINEFKFTSESVRQLSENLFGLLSKGQMRLYPDDDLERELLRLEAKQTAYGWRIDHAAGGFSDRAMALGMAAMHSVVDAAKGLVYPFGPENITEEAEYKPGAGQLWLAYKWGYTEPAHIVFIQQRDDVFYQFDELVVSSRSERDVVRDVILRVIGLPGYDGPTLKEWEKIWDGKEPWPRPWPEVWPEAAGDPSAVQFRTELKERGIGAASPKKVEHDEEEGQGVLRGAISSRRLLLHPRCVETIRGLQNLREGEEGCDALRFLTWRLRREFGLVRA